MVPPPHIFGARVFSFLSHGTTALGFSEPGAFFAQDCNFRLFSCPKPGAEVFFGVLQRLSPRKPVGRTRVFHRACLALPA